MRNRFSWSRCVPYKQVLLYITSLYKASSTYDSDHPHHQVGQRRQPHKRHGKRDHKPWSPANTSTVGNREIEHQLERQSGEPDRELPPGVWSSEDALCVICGGAVRALAGWRTAFQGWNCVYKNIMKIMRCVIISFKCLSLNSLLVFKLIWARKLGYNSWMEHLFLCFFFVNLSINNCFYRWKCSCLIYKL